ncbi:MAG: PD-(D/E)XK nuclease family protein, partial [Verrucomicrobiota bacterium]
ILSFQRLAEMVFERLGKPAPELLAEEGRVMVLRALLEQKRGELKVFRASARLPGFARQLSQLLRELQQFHLTPQRLEALADGVGQSNRLDARLRDLAVILSAYGDWLQAHQLQDADQMLDLATAELRENAGQFKIENLWLDGFAQMTPQERQLLKTVVGCAEKATIAFCLNHEPDQPPPWHSLWAPVTETFLRCRDELSALPHVQVSVELLRRDPLRSRFQSQPLLRHLEQHWARPIAFSGQSSEANNDDTAESQPALRLVACANPEAEVEFAAHEIRRFVRECKGRFRDVAVLLRSLTGYHHLIRRTFSRYDIPFFLDRRESVTHHPLAELTRYALRIVAYSWEHEDWFGALKTGLVHGDEASIDRLENEALARGWRGKAFWSEPIPSLGAEMAEHPLERLRQKIVPPFQQLAAALSVKERRPSGQELAAAIRALWTDLKIGQQLERWSSAAQQRDGLPNPALHETVWDQMAEWLKNIELAFGAEALPLKEWLPIVEAGLGSLSVGVIPPALDQVLVGTIDRSRNPDLRSAFVLGVNEGVFPSPPPAPALLNRADRETLAAHNAPLGPDYLQQIGHEHYYGYIACTRSREQTTLTFAHQDSGGRELNPSVFIGDLQRMFPSLAVEEFSGHANWKSSEHWSELVVPLLKHNAALPLEWRQIAPPIEDAWAKWEQGKASETAAQLPTELVEKIYGRELKTSVSGLEDFAACPFRFFAARGLRAEERVEFEIDPREKGSFQHELLSEFHLRLKMSGKRWRDLAPTEARLLIRAIGQERLPGFRDGLFVANQARRFTGEMLIEGLERLIETLIGWMPQYQFDPSAVEIGFGLKDSALPAWRIDLDGEHALLLRGRIDRVDIHRLENGEALAVVV